MKHFQRNRFCENQPKGIRVVLLLALVVFAFTPVPAATPWWNSGWGYRVRLDIDPGGYVRYEKPVERAINFTSLFSAVGTSGTFNENSLRVIEVDGSENVIDTTVVFQFDKDPDYNATSKASGILVLAMKGTTGSSATRHYDVYFDNRAGFTAPSFTGEVSVDGEEQPWQGLDCAVAIRRFEPNHVKRRNHFPFLANVENHSCVLRFSITCYG